jgi:hypothetical protein
MTKFLGVPVRAKSPCPLFVVRGWLRRGTVSEFMKIHAKFETSVSNILIACAFTTDNGPLTTDKRSLRVQRAESAFFSG